MEVKVSELTEKVTQLETLNQLLKVTSSLLQNLVKSDFIIYFQGNINKD